MKTLPDDLLKKFTAIVGESRALHQPTAISPYLTEYRGRYNGSSPLVLLPSCTQEVSRILQLANATKTTITPQGGNTGLVGGQTPRQGENDIVLSLELMNHIREIDSIGNTISVDAGCKLADIQKIAKDNNRLFPLSLPSEESCQIGGNIATNAGGVSVLAYGNMRQLCLGLEVVLPNGEIWDGMYKLVKDNSGYDLRDLFIGSEGTLGVITGAILKLFPNPIGHQVALAAVSSPKDALQVLQLSRSIADNTLKSFEFIALSAIQFIIKHTDNKLPAPLKNSHPWYILIDIASTESEIRAYQIITEILNESISRNIILEAKLASSEEEANKIWNIRKKISLAQSQEGKSIKHDISVPLDKIPYFLLEAEKKILSTFPEARICCFGHLGDGNIHFNIFPPLNASEDQFTEHWDKISNLVHSIVLSYNGSIAAEHGIGQLKRDYLEKISSKTKITIMKKIKRALDPVGIMNPGKVISI
ncbi:D-2-hydroxyglutarate dehydrogenase [Liberibacter crescens BT-1]|uniref:D-2-hydroxyglutarate dehydrogenase n=1 Tax=Liberibacter crescens (strain BT-1) TaxID=1215343 RepID=L0ETU5_LIBCB|nr:FAD-binding oxidoreductase [Liberibacter crescens]AGA64053.1 D-2-hydroxyglutarate dehydrogenase [Liberibacter crescens BT-1]AMC12354.1 2-hydroxyacid dehydrogenase [Liberibacter crescens]